MKAKKIFKKVVKQLQDEGFRFVKCTRHTIRFYNPNFGVIAIAKTPSDQMAGRQAQRDLNRLMKAK